MERHGGGANLSSESVAARFLFFRRRLPSPSISRGRQGANGWRVTKGHDVSYQLPDLGLREQVFPRWHWIAAAPATVGDDVEQYVCLQFRTISQGWSSLGRGLRPVAITGAKTREDSVARLNVLRIAEVDSARLLA